MDQVEQIREKLDIVSFISEVVALKKAGRNFKSNCPFHSDKSPSFMVSPDRQIWHCFGCGKGGDIYAFLMEYEHIEFGEALRLLAQRAGVQLVNRQETSAVTSKKERIYVVNSLAKEFYHYVLTKHTAGKNALDYLEKRGISQKVIETFQLGFSPAVGNSLSKYLLDKKNFTKEEIIDAGLAYIKGSKIIDFFWGRLMFPLIDHRDNVTGFSGRVMDTTNVPSKYINTRETLVYHKGEQVYGLNITKDEIRKANQVILVEGEFDVISCYMHGVGNVVAVKGTALTENQVNLLGRFAQKMTFCFDNDSAGQEAIKRSLPIVERKGLSPTVIAIPNGKDADESLKTNAGQFKKAVKEDTSAYDYLLQQAIHSVDIKAIEGKKYVADILLPLVSQITNEIIKEHYLKKISSELDTSYESITREIQRLKVKDQAIAQKITVAKVKRPKEEILEEYLLAMILQNERAQQLVDQAFVILKNYIAKERSDQKIFFYLREYFLQHETFNQNVFAESLPRELLDAYNHALLLPLAAFENDDKISREVEKIATQLKVAYIHKQMKQLASDIRQKEDEEQSEEVERLKKEYSLLASQLHDF